MEVRYNVSGERRKELITAMADLLEAKLRYNGAPSFSYTVGDYLVDKQGTVVARYAPNKTPAALEKDIQALLEV